MARLPGSKDRQKRKRKQLIQTGLALGATVGLPLLAIGLRLRNINKANNTIKNVRKVVDGFTPNYVPPKIKIEKPDLGLSAKDFVDKYVAQEMAKSKPAVQIQSPELEKSRLQKINKVRDEISTLKRELKFKAERKSLKNKSLKRAFKAKSNQGRSKKLNRYNTVYQSTVKQRYRDYSSNLFLIDF